MATLLDIVTPPVFNIGSNPAIAKPWSVKNQLNGTESKTLGGRSMDVLYRFRDIGPLNFPALSAAQIVSVEALLDNAWRNGLTLYLQLPGSVTIYAGYIPSWNSNPVDPLLTRYALEFTFLEAITP